MAVEQSGFDPKLMADNMDALASNPYPGRGIVLGMSYGGEHAVQAYWVMGRSANSRNRILAESDTGSVRTEAFDASQVVDPSLIIYNALRTADMQHSTHIVSNGDQTDTIFDELGRFRARPSVTERFNDALTLRTFEPDDPNFTPRISGLTFTGLNGYGPHPGVGFHDYSIIRRNPTTGTPEHTFGHVDFTEIPNGTGICFHTYAGDGDPLPPFAGSPYAIPVGESAEETARALWGMLNLDNKVAIVAKTIERRTGAISHHIINELVA